MIIKKIQKKSHHYLVILLLFIKKGVFKDESHYNVLLFAFQIMGFLLTNQMISYHRNNSFEKLSASLYL
ncbi:hypothetical protein HMPREF1218_0474 [Hoylesella pleuritidis F0068]|uniref:Uncharacterized protein n=1 Tax=Hoylesella pleuritidis F0068 TaxID=1081904 RepID=U2KQC1_9BACT|nr:hypothetical protein HMPREF1218_0474 [Hoylesella pleuritidis F0068]